MLIVDDDDGVRSLLSDILSGAGYNVLCAADGQEALDRLSVVRPDLIISDCRMPVIDGSQLFRIVKSDVQTRFIPYVVVTAAVDQKTKESLFAGTIDAFILKPFDNDAVLRTVNRFLNTVRVMVVEDDESIRELAKMALAGQGFDVTVAEDGRDALEHLDRVDVVFADLEMPRMGGTALTRALPDDVAVILTSGGETADALDPDVRSRIEGFLPKPYDMEELGVMIRLAAGRRGL